MLKVVIPPKVAFAPVKTIVLVPGLKVPLSFIQAAPEAEARESDVPVPPFKIPDEAILIDFTVVLAGKIGSLSVVFPSGMITSLVEEGMPPDQFSDTSQTELTVPNQVKFGLTD